MKVVLLITLMFTLALVYGNQNPRPCLPNWNNNAYNNFLHRHVLFRPFNRGSSHEWRQYLQENNLCHRRRQTFMEKSNQLYIQEICQGSGWRHNSCSNLCISDSPIMVYDLTVDNNCQIQTLSSGTRYVVVACDVVNNVCRPVHFDGSTNSAPNTQFGSCKGGDSLTDILSYYRSDL